MSIIPELDSNIIRQCQRRDTGAFRTLVTAYTSYAYALAYRILWNEQDAEDVVQESFMRVWNSVQRFEIGRKFSTWLYTIVTNLCRDKLRKRKRINENEVSGDFECVPWDDIAEPSQGFVAIIQHLASGLPLTQRFVFVLRDLQDISVRDVSRILDISEASVKSNLYYARKSLREKYNQLIQ